MATMTNVRCSLLTVKNETNSKISIDEQVFYAERAGIKFIPMYFSDNKSQAVYSQTERRIRPFQSCRLTIGTNGGKIVPIVEYDKSKNGVDCGRGVLEFRPDKLGELRALCIDTPYNRNKLMYSYFHVNRNWTIDDKEIDREVRDEAKKLGLDKIERIMSKDELLSSISGKAEQIEVENYELKKKLEQLEKENRALLKNSAKTPKMVEIDKYESQDWIAARTEVHKDHAAFIEKLKKDNPKDWALHDDYKNKIFPLIEQRYERLAKNGNV